jgi:hypothetical protein
MSTELPPLPDPEECAFNEIGDPVWLYTADQMRACWDAAIEAAADLIEGIAASQCTDRLSASDTADEIRALNGKA